jgi:BirA family biotin operon repressor/biotin-[acetyl-CoA-carboxylase] ligase
VNDVFCHGKKVCGILTEAALDLESGGLQYAIVGIGVNLFPPKDGFPPELQDTVGTVFPARPQGLEARSQLAGAILNHFFAFYPDLAQAPFFEDYRKRSLVLGQPITILERGQTRPAVALDLNPDFSLHVREADGTLRDLSSGEVSVRPGKG